MSTYAQLISFGPRFSGGRLCTLRVYHYVTGTATLKDVYTDREKTTTAAQPAVSDSDGMVTFYADGLYKFRIDGSTDGVTYTTLDTIDKWAVVDQSSTLSGEGAAIASASTLTLGTDGDFFHVTGSTGPIIAISGTQNEVTLAFDSTPTLTHSGGLILKDATSYTAVVNDVVTFRNEGAGVWREVSRGVAFVKLQDTALLYGPSYQDFRLSLTTALPVTVADVTAAGTLYAVPYTGNRVALYDGTNWIVRSSAQFSLALTLTSGKPYDVFCYDVAGVPTLEVLVWTNDTTRATALVYQDGVLVKSGATTRRYLGSLYSSGANTTEDSVTKRYLWNYYHRIDRPMRVTDGTDSWAYTTATFRQARATATNQLDYIQGVNEERVNAVAMGLFNSSDSTAHATVGIGVDSTSANSAEVFAGGKGETGSVHKIMVQAHYYGYPGVGRHTLVWLEYSAAVGTTTWYGDNGGVINQSGIIGSIRG